MRRLPHIAIVSIGYPPVPHVSGFRAHGFATELVTSGCDVTVITSGTSVQPAVSDANSSRDAERGAETGIRAPLDSSKQWPTRRRPSVLYRHFAAGHAFDWVDAGERIAGHRLPRGSIVWGIHGGSSAHELARRLAASCEGAWIADFKDDWLPIARHRTARLLETYFMKHRLATASSITAASQLQATDIETTFSIPASPIYTGVDIEWWRTAEPRDLGSTFNIVYTGHLTYTMDLRTLITGLSSIKDTFRDDVRFHYFGNHGDQLRTALAEAGCLPWYIDHGWVSHREAAAYQRAADLLLHLPLTRSPNVPVKFLEYLASGRPIISIPGERDAGFQRLQRTEPAIAMVTSPAQLSQQMSTLLNEWRIHGRSPDRPRDVSAFTWEHQTMALLEVFREASDRNVSARTSPSL